MIDNKRIDNKHSVISVLCTDMETEKIILAKRKGDGTFEPIPDDEPVILFRGRDKLALPMLRFYRELCVRDGCTDFQLESMDDMIRRFQEFADASSTMKQPGCTKGM